MALHQRTAQPERDRNAVEEIPRSPSGTPWNSEDNREKREPGQTDEARKRQKIQRQLDEALADSFPASDPVSIVTSNEEEDWGAAPASDDRAGAKINPQRGS